MSLIPKCRVWRALSCRTMHCLLLCFACVLFSPLQEHRTQTLPAQIFLWGKNNTGELREERAVFAATFKQLGFPVCCQPAGLQLQQRTTAFIPSCCSAIRTAQDSSVERVLLVCIMIPVWGFCKLVKSCLVIQLHVQRKAVLQKCVPYLDKLDSFFEEF